MRYSLESSVTAEVDLFLKEERCAPDAFRIFEYYHSAESWRDWSERMEVSTGFFSSDELVFVQRHILECIRKKGLVVETLPTSNLRISLYRSIEGLLETCKWSRTEQRRLGGGTSMTRTELIDALQNGSYEHQEELFFITGVKSMVSLVEVDGLPYLRVGETRDDTTTKKDLLGRFETAPSRPRSESIGGSRGSSAR